MNQADSKNNDYQYDAFISYNGEDKAFAEALEKALENYDPPKDLAVPQRHLKIFRYEGDMTGADYPQAIQGHLDKSAKLIILCSPHARKSTFVNDEIHHFGESNSTEDIIPILVGGVPNNAATGEQEDEKAFPQALCDIMGMPLATSYLEFEPGKDKIDKGLFKGAWYTILANIYGLSRDELEQRDKRKKIRKRKVVTGIVSTVMVALLSLTSVALWQKNDAQKNFLQANYYLAKIFEEQANVKYQQAQTAVSPKTKSLSLQQSLLFAVAALEQTIHPDSLALSFETKHRIFGTGLFKTLFYCRWYTSGSPFNSVAFSPDGKTIASASNDKTIRLWDSESGKEMNMLTGHTGSVNSVAFSPDGKTIASASDDKTIRLWDSESGREMHMLKGHIGSVSSVAFSPDSKTIASGSGDTSIRLWDSEMGRELNTLAEPRASATVNSVVFSPDGKTIASASGSYFAANNLIRLWDSEWGKEMNTLNGHTNDVNCVAFSPDGKTIASASDDKTIRLWDSEMEKELKTLTGHTGSVSSVAFSPDGKTIASGSWDKSIRLWDSESGKEMLTLKGHTTTVSSVAFSPDGKTIVSGSDDTSIRLWDSKSGEELKILVGHTGWVNSVAFSPDGKTIASASNDKTIRLWDSESGKEMNMLTGHTGSVESVVFSPDGKTIASASRDKSIRLWDFEIYSLFLKNNKATPLFLKFMQGVRFWWQIEQAGLRFRFAVQRDLAFYPLLDPPRPDENKFDQIVRWAQAQLDRETVVPAYTSK